MMGYFCSYGVDNVVRLHYSFSSVGALISILAFLQIIYRYVVAMKFTATHVDIRFQAFAIYHTNTR